MEKVVSRKEYSRIIAAELALRPDDKYHSSFLYSYVVSSYVDIRAIVEQLREVAINSTVQRSYITTYGLDTREQYTLPAQNFDGTKATRNLIFESDAAHANLLAAILDHALSACYGPDFGDPTGEHPVTVDGYTYREIMQAARAHDLGENVTGDCPDNSSVSPSLKAAFEHQFIANYLGKTTTEGSKSGEHVYRLLTEMDSRDGPTGRLIYICDKFAASFMTLTYDSLGFPPKLSPNAPWASERDKAEIAICEYHDKAGRALASEMWAADMLKIRNLIQYDDTGFVTACLVMYTLMVHDHWYTWRERDYRTPLKST